MWSWHSENPHCWKTWFNHRWRHSSSRSWEKCCPGDILGAVIFFSLSDLTMNKMSYNAIQKHSNMFRMRREREKERKTEKERERIEYWHAWQNKNKGGLRILNGEREKNWKTGKRERKCVWACVCGREREGEREKVRAETWGNVTESKFVWCPQGSMLLSRKKSSHLQFRFESKISDRLLWGSFNAVAYIIKIYYIAKI